MTRGRRPEVARLVERLQGSGAAKARLIAILDVLTRRRTVGQVCAPLGISERRLHSLRHCALQAALGSLEPSPIGRPAQAPAEGDTRVATLQAEIQDLRLDLMAAQVREEIALVLPDLRRRAGGRHKTARQRQDRRRSAIVGAQDGCGASGATPRARCGPGEVRPGSAKPAGASAASALEPSHSAVGPHARG
jgi:hypothetical protein